MEKSPLDRAIEFAGGSEAKLAAALGFSQPAINKAKKGQAGPRLALAIHRLTGGEISAHEIRPDIWRDRDSVPTEVSLAQQDAVA